MPHPPTNTPSPALLQLTGIGKRFGSVQALHDVSMTINSGVVHGVLGANGAGKSTLMNILFGLLQPDSGALYARGKPVRIVSPWAAARLGIGMVHQHFMLSPQLTIFENIALAVQRGPGFLKSRYVAKLIAESCDRMGWKLNLGAKVEKLDVGQQQRVEIIKALCTGGQMLILDEPTAVLAPQEVQALLQSMRLLAKQNMAVVFISHKLAEVTQICQKLSILKKGRLVYDGAATLDHHTITQYMMGSEVGVVARSSPPSRGPVRLRAANMRVTDSADTRPLLTDISFDLNAGEILGIAGVDGNGQGALFATLLALRLPAAGEIVLNGISQKQMPRHLWARQFAAIPDDRQAWGLAMALPVLTNLLLKGYDDANLSPHHWIRPRRWRTHADNLLRRFNVRSQDASRPVWQLSGGNQQKAVLAREVGRGHDVIVAFNPTRGLDVQATTFVFDQLLQARQAGAGVLLINSDLDELLAISDRVMVLYDGKLSATPWPHCSREDIGRMMIGAKPS